MRDGEAGELDRLARFLTRPGPAFGLAMATYADAVLAHDYRAQLIDRVGAQGCRVGIVEFGVDDDRVDLVGRIAAAGAAGAEVDALFVIGLERLVVDARGRPRNSPAIANLNQRRDELPELWSVRVVFWLAKAAYPQLTDVAWDLVQVMLTTAEFERTRELEVQLESTRRRPPPSWMRLADERERPALEAQLRAVEELAESATDLHGIADAAASAGELAVRLGQLERAVPLLERSADALAQLSAFADAAAQHRRVAEVELMRGKLDAAERHAVRARALAERHELDIDTDVLSAELRAEEGEAEAFAEPAGEADDADALGDLAEPAPEADDVIEIDGGGAVGAGAPMLEPPSPAPAETRRAPSLAASPAAKPKPIEITEDQRAPSLAPGSAAMAKPIEVAESAGARRAPHPPASSAEPIGFAKSVAPVPVPEPSSSAALQPGAPQPQPSPKKPAAPSVPQRAKLSLSPSVPAPASESFDLEAERREAARAELLAADIELRRGRHADARARLEGKVLPLFEALADHRGLAQAWAKLAELLELDDRLDEALELRRERELPAWRAAGAEREAAETQAKIAELLARRGQVQTALGLLRDEVLPAVEHVGDAASQTLALSQYAELLDAVGQTKEAAQLRRDEQAPLLERQDDLRTRATKLEQQAREHERAGEHLAALAVLRDEVLPIHARLEDVQARAATLVAIAAVLAKLGRNREALDMLEREAVPAFIEVGDTPGRTLALQRITELRELERARRRDLALRIGSLALAIVIVVTLTLLQCVDQN